MERRLQRKETTYKEITIKKTTCRENLYRQ